ncbi:MAG: hypothetical protein FWD28_03915 [Treponema sp.]|nr:hypothetical protein [Treponema sp.]
MEIKINDKILDAKPENENTVGEVLSSVEQWLESSGHRISELKIDNELVNVSEIGDVFAKNIDSVNLMEIRTLAIGELAAASILNLIEDIKEYEGLDFNGKKAFFETWKTSAAAGFLSAEMPDLFGFCVNTFSNGEIGAQTLLSITEEIQREVIEPVKELSNIEPVLNEICERLIRLPLDIQTGKDALAAQTIQIFSAVTEKIIRIFRQLDIQGYLSLASGSEKPLNQLITEFWNVLKELLEAYEKNDSILVGDITEYEAAPKLKKLYFAILENIQKKTQDEK